MMNFLNVTNISCGFIIVVLLWYLFYAIKIWKISFVLGKVNKEDDLLKALSDTKLKPLQESYEQSINIETLNGYKTNIPASEYISDISTAQAIGVNLKVLDTASATLVGLGLLGTFLGLTLGIDGFDSSSSKSIQNSIQGLLSGMGTAFTTSLLGMGLSLAYTVSDKLFRNKVAQQLYRLTNELDKKYYIDDVALSELYQRQNLNKFYSEIQFLMDAQTTSIVNEVQRKLTYIDQEGKEKDVSSAIREILTENSQQTKALKSFSTDLAIELNNGFDAVIDKQMQEKIIPLMQNIDQTTNRVIEHIDQMSASVSSPVTDMLETVIADLKNSMLSIVQEFKTNLSTSATNELENLAHSLGSATQALGSFPENMDRISVTLQTTIEEVKNVVAEISSTSANSNSTAMKQMQEQITFATTSMSTAIAEVREVMTSITQTSEQSSQEISNKLITTVNQISTSLDNTINQISASVANSVRSITEDVSDKQANLLALQETTIEEVKNVVTEISNDSAASNSAVMQKMQEQITLAATSMSNAIMEVKEVMVSVTQSSQQSSDEISNKLIIAANQIGAYLDNTMNQISASVANSMRNITEDVSEKQSNLLALQESTTLQTGKLLDRFNQGLDKLGQMNGHIAETMAIFQQTQGQISGTTAHLQAITNDMKIASETFRRSQTEYNEKLAELQNRIQDNIDAISELLQDSGNISMDYVQKFETIKMGLGSIFSQLQNGLTEYSRTVAATTQNYLNQYSSSLTSATDALSSAIQQQNEVVETLSETLNRKR